MKKILTFIVFLALIFCNSPAMAGSNVTLAWDANSEPDLSGYMVHYGQASGDYQQAIDVGNVTIYTVNDLPDGIWYFAVTAYDASSNMSDYSNEVNASLDATPPLQPKNLVITVIVKVNVQ